MDKQMRERLDNLKRKLKIDSDEMLAVKIGCSFSTLRAWLEGRSQPGRFFKREIEMLEEEVNG